MLRQAIQFNDDNSIMSYTVYSPSIIVTSLLLFLRNRLELTNLNLPRVCWRQAFQPPAQLEIFAQVTSLDILDNHPGI